MDCLHLATEYDNDAELPLAEMDFGPGDTPEEYAIKARMLLIYNERLNERARRKVSFYVAFKTGRLQSFTYTLSKYTATGTLPIIRDPLNKKSTRHSGPRIAAHSVE